MPSTTLRRSGAPLASAALLATLAVSNGAAPAAAEPDDISEATASTMPAWMTSTPRPASSR